MTKENQGLKETMKPSTQGAGIFYISDRWFLNSAWSIRHSFVFFMQRLTEEKADNSWSDKPHCLSVRSKKAFQSFQELMYTIYPACVLQWNIFLRHYIFKKCFIHLTQYLWSTYHIFSNDASFTESKQQGFESLESN